MHPLSYSVSYDFGIFTLFGGNPDLLDFSQFSLSFRINWPSIILVIKISLKMRYMIYMTFLSVYRDQVQLVSSKNEVQKNARSLGELSYSTLVSALCLHTAPVTNVGWKPFLLRSKYQTLCRFSSVTGWWTRVIWVCQRENLPYDMLFASTIITLARMTILQKNENRI